MTMVSRVDGYQRRHGWAGLPLAVMYKFADDQGATPRGSDFNAHQAGCLLPGLPGKD